MDFIYKDFAFSICCLYWISGAIYLRGRNDVDNIWRGADEQSSRPVPLVRLTSLFLLGGVG